MVGKGSHAMQKRVNPRRGKDMEEGRTKKAVQFRSSGEEWEKACSCPEGRQAMFGNVPVMSILPEKGSVEYKVEIRKDNRYRVKEGGVGLRTSRQAPGRGMHERQEDIGRRVQRRSVHRKKLRMPKQQTRRSRRKQVPVLVMQGRRL